MSGGTVLPIVNIKDIAKLAGVSYSTVSKALNDSPLVKSATKQRILAIAERYGYQRNLLATQLVSGKTRLIGLVLDDVSNPVFAHLAKDLNQALRSRDYRMLMAISPDGVALLNQLRVDGLILWGELIHAHPEILEAFSGLRMPAFILGTDETLTVPHISIDRESGIHEAVRYLTAYGHRRIGIVGNAQEIKVKAFVEAIVKMGLQVHPDWLIPAESTWEGGYRAMRDIQFHADSPTAFVGLNNLITKGVLRALLERGYSVPGDVSLIGYDNLPEMQHAEVPITTVGPSLEAMCTQSADLMITLIERRVHANPVILEPVLVERSSVARCRKADLPG